MRILMVTNTYAPARNGVAMWVALSVRELRARGHVVDVLTYSHDRRDSGMPGVYEVPGRAGIDPDFRVGLLPPRVPAEIEGRAYDVVHVHHPILLGPVGVAFGRASGAKVCFTCHSVYTDYFDEYYFGWGRGLRGWFDDKVARFVDTCDAVLAPSSRVERWLRESGATVRIERTEPPADTTRIVARDRAEARRELGLGTEPVAFYVGRIAAEKRVGPLVEEFAGALGEMPAGAVLVLGGSGKRVPTVRRLVRRLGLQERVRLLGALDAEALGRWYSAADVCVSASRSETGPLTVVEAMSCGTPAIGLAAPGFEDRITDGVNGLLVRDEPGALGGAIARVLADGDLRARLSAGARSTSCRCSPDAVTEALLGVYDSLRA